MSKSGRTNVLKFLVVMCAISCIMILFANIPTLFSKSWFLHHMTLGIIRSGGALGFLGNLIVIIAMAYCYGSMAYEGFMILSYKSHHKQALLYGLICTGICILSMIFSIAGKMFVLGDLVVVLFAILYCVAVLINAPD